jgi:polynucleotide 5'-kinase involved in rRNA processing
LKRIDLPKETHYLIDKVVRQRAKVGPIGVDNSELINMELEEEYKEKN